VRRVWTPFDYKVIQKEFLYLPDQDQVKLHQVMDLYEDCGGPPEAPIVVKTYQEAIRMIKHSSKSRQGRCLFYVSESGKQYEELTILTIYKKESQDVPKTILERAKKRKDAHLRRKRSGR
jgi:phage-related protein